MPLLRRPVVSPDAIARVANTEDFSVVRFVHAMYMCRTKILTAAGRAIDIPSCRSLAQTEDKNGHEHKNHHQTGSSPGIVDEADEGRSSKQYQNHQTDDSATC